MKKYRILLPFLMGVCGLRAQAPQQTRIVWENGVPAFTSTYSNGDDVLQIATDHVIVATLIDREIDQLFVRMYVLNRESNTSNIDVLPENIHLFRVGNGELVSIKRIDAEKLARSRERHTRIAQSIAAGMVGAGSRTTATGQATYSDGTTADYTVTTSDPQSQQAAIDRAQGAISRANTFGQLIVSQELKRNTLSPGHRIMGAILFPKQKDETRIFVEASIAGVTYCFPVILEKKSGKGIARDPLPIELAR